MEGFSIPSLETLTVVNSRASVIFSILVPDGAKSIPSKVLNRFVLLPSLTHLELDLSTIRVTPEVLATLSSSGRMHLHSLSLAKYIRLTRESIRNLMINFPVVRELKELNPYGVTSRLVWEGGTGEMAAPT